MTPVLQSVNLLAAAPAKLKEFYVHVFKMAEDAKRSHPPRFFYLNTGSGCNLLIQDSAAVNGETGFAGFELGFEVDDLGDILQDIITAGGSVVVAEQTMGWGRAVTVADPEGHRINIYVFNR